LKNTPKALANFSPGLEHREYPGDHYSILLNPERVRLAMNPFRVEGLFSFFPGLSRRSNPWLKLPNDFGVLLALKLNQYRNF
jgi:hypothetical protein